MQPPSAAPSTGRIPCQGLLLAVSLLTFWNPPTTAQLSIESVPFIAAEGTDVLLLARNVPVNVLGFNWFKGGQVDEQQAIVTYAVFSGNTTLGPAHSGRETIYQNGSLLFKNVTKEDTGSYTLQTTDFSFRIQIATGQFLVYEELPKPYINSSNPDPVEGEDFVTLTCEPETPNTTYLWWINDQSIRDGDRLELSNNNRTLTLFNVTRSDTGPYVCGTQNPVSASRSDPLTLNISYGPDAPIINPPESNFHSGTNLSLFCQAASNPPAQYSWFFNERSLESTQELLVPNLTTNNSGSYVCVAHNSVTGLNRTTVKNITVYEELPKPYITSNNFNPVEGEDFVTLTCEPETQNTTYLWWINNQNISDGDRLKLSNNNRTLTLFNVTRSDTGPYVCGTQNSVSASRSDPLTLNISYGPDAPIINPPESNFHSGTNLSLFCQATSNPPAQYSWFFNERSLESTQELLVPNLTTNNSGSYVCVAHNSVTGLNRTTVKNITVFELVTKPHLRAHNTTVAEHGSVELMCDSNDTDISIRWLFKDESLLLPRDRMQLSRDNSSLTIDPVLREDAGEYQCEVYNPVSSSKSDPLRLEVTYDPSLSGGAIAGIVIGVVAGVAAIGALTYFLFCRKTGGASDQHDLTEHKPSASNHSRGPSDNSPNQVDEVSYSSLNFNIKRPKQATSATSQSSTATETVYSEVKKK